MRQVAVDSGLDFDSDFISMGDGNDFVSDNATLYNYLATNQNATQNAIW